MSFLQSALAGESLLDACAGVVGETIVPHLVQGNRQHLGTALLDNEHAVGDRDDGLVGQCHHRLSVGCVQH